METTFCELKGKEVINVVDGKRLGRIIDLVFDTCCGHILGFVVPAYSKSFNIFKVCDDIFIPYGSVCKIGEDVILVKICLPDQPAKMIGAKHSRCSKSMQVNANDVQVQNQTAESEPADICTNAYPEMQNQN